MNILQKILKKIGFIDKIGDPGPNGVSFLMSFFFLLILERITALNLITLVIFIK